MGRSVPANNLGSRICLCLHRYWTKMGPGEMDPTVTAVIFIIMMTAEPGDGIWILPAPKENIRVTLANKTGQDTLCLSLATPGNPFSTCLVGVPADNWPSHEQARHFGNS